jgi:hypothetical protein
MRGRVCLAAFLLSASAHARDPWQRPRLFIGMSSTASMGSSLEVDGHRVPGEGGDLNASLDAGFLAPISSPNFGLGAIGRLGSWQSTWASAKGETRVLADVAVMPELRWLQTRGRRGVVGWHLAMPIGYTWASIAATNGRAVHESYDPGRGVNLGIVFGFEGSGRHSGGYVDAGYLLHVIWMDHTATRVADSGVEAVEAYRFVNHTVMMSLGYLFRL